MSLPVKKLRRIIRKGHLYIIDIHAGGRWLAVESTVPGAGRIDIIYHQG